MWNVKVKKKNLKTEELDEIVIKIGKSYIDSNKMKVPQSMENWDKNNQPTKEYYKMLNVCLTLARYIANQLNTGPEVAKSITKRTIATKTIIWELLFSTFLNGYHRSGILSETLHDIYMDNNGKTKVEIMLAEMQTQFDLQQKEKPEQKTKVYRI